MSLAPPVEQDALWKELDRVLAPRHYAKGHDAFDSINRLLRKNERVKETVGALQLTRGNAIVLVECWDLARLVSLLHASQFTNDEPAFPTGAVVIVRGIDCDFLIDGRRRVNH